MILYGDNRYDYVQYYERKYREPIRQEVEYDADGFPSLDNICNAFSIVREKLKRYHLLDNYYQGIQPIWKREWKSVTGIEGVKVMCNEPRQLTQTAASFFLSMPINYDCLEDIDGQEEALTALIRQFNRQQIGEHDLSLATTASRFGVAYEYTYFYTKKTASGRVLVNNQGLPVSELKTISLSPLNAAVVYHNEVDLRKAYAMYFVEEPTKKFYDKSVSYRVTVYTDLESREYTVGLSDDKLKVVQVAEPQQVKVGAVPITEYENNAERTSDWEHVISLIDVKNEILSGRIDSVAVHIDSILTILNDSERDIAGYSKAELKELIAALQKSKVMLLRPGERAEFVNNPLDQTTIHTLQVYLDKMIHKLTSIPDYTDESLAAVSSGRALKLKLQPFISLTNAKAAQFRKGLIERLNIYAGASEAAIELDVANIKMTFTMSIPASDLENAQVIATIKGSGVAVSDATLMEILSFIDNADAEIEKKINEDEKLGRTTNNASDLYFYEPYTSEGVQAEADNNADIS